ncbi:MAG: nitronate monooxygenase [Hyphomicrobium sp.]|nr:nitronate monooxygenase [Hyphomicrobium sp.]
MTAHPLNLNFFVFNPPGREAISQRLSRAISDLSGIDGVDCNAIPSGIRSFDESMLRLLFELPPSVISFHLGLPSLEMIAALKEKGWCVLATATTVGEARAVEAAGIDVVVAQGWEAGGHRGVFNAKLDAQIGLLSLVPQIVDAVSIPVIAAGGIADGRGIAAALALGASGVQLGTAFLSTKESGASDAAKSRVSTAKDTDTVVSRAFSGRPARLLRNRVVDALLPLDEEFLEFPRMLEVTRRLQSRNGSETSLDFEFLLFGQSAGMRSAGSAPELLNNLVHETTEAVRDIVAEWTPSPSNADAIPVMGAECASDEIAGDRRF